MELSISTAGDKISSILLSRIISTEYISQTKICQPHIFIHKCMTCGSLVQLEKCVCLLFPPFIIFWKQSLKSISGAGNQNRIPGLVFSNWLLVHLCFPRWENYSSAEENMNVWTSAQKLMFLGVPHLQIVSCISISYSLNNSRISL